MAAFHDDFEGDRLDPAVWFPHYLPAWSSRSATRATYRLADSCLSLSIPTDQPLWCPDLHPEPLRVSGVQSGNRSGPVGSTLGQQRFREGLAVREAQPRFEGWLPASGTVAVRCRMELSERSMAAMWLSGFEDEPDESGELCVVEVFGRSIRDGSAEIGVGVKQLHDPRLVPDFVAPRLAIDVGELHEYAVTWDGQHASFTVDGRDVHACRTAPAYPMQVMLAVFDFPAWGTADDVHVPALHVDAVTGATASAGAA